jgi:hypothetical protein
MYCNKNATDYDHNYKQIEAMYWKGYSTQQICNNMSHMQKIEVIDIIQEIEGVKFIKREMERRRRERAQ